MRCASFLRPRAPSPDPSPAPSPSPSPSPSLTLALAPAPTPGLIYLFYEPNPGDPLNHEAAALFRDNPEQFKRTVTRTLQGQSIGGVQFPRLV